MAKAPTPTDARSVKTDKPISEVFTVPNIKQKIRLKENATLISAVAMAKGRRMVRLDLRYLSSASKTKKRAITTYVINWALNIVLVDISFSLVVKYTSYIPASVQRIGAMERP